MGFTFSSTTGEDCRAATDTAAHGSDSTEGETRRQALEGVAAACAHAHMDGRTLARTVTQTVSM